VPAASGDQQEEARVARRSIIRLQESLELTFALRTWLAIGPAVLVGLLLCAGLAELIFRPSIQNMLLMMGAGGVVMAICAVPGQFMWNRVFRSRVLQPLHDVGDVMSRAGEGDLTVRATIHHADEIGVLTDECNRLIESLADIADNVLRSAESVSAAATELSASSQEINASAMEISTSVQQIAHGAELQSRKVEETTSAMESIVSTVNTVAETATEASRYSQDAAQSAEHGREATDEAISKIAEVQSAIETLAGSVELLGARSSEIGKIVDVITSIADQTNLLSLNAAIEAARAGESGRGFAVVAEEVRKLAEGSGKAAEQIGELIKEVQSETAKAVKYMEIGTREVAVGSEVVGRSGATLTEITEAVHRSAALADKIASAMADQRERTVAVDRAMHDIAAVVEQNAASAEQTAAAAEEQTACMEEVSSSAQDLADMAHRLEDSVHMFRLGDGQ
jgi:methyl-accepting chemotaxis protein